MEKQEMSNWDKIKDLNRDICDKIEKYVDDKGKILKETIGEDGLFRFVEEMYRKYKPETVKISNYNDRKMQELFEFPTESDDEINKYLKAYQNFVSIKGSGDGTYQGIMEFLKNRFVIEYGDVGVGLEEFGKCFKPKTEDNEDYYSKAIEKAIEYINDNTPNEKSYTLDKNTFIARLHNYRKNGIKDKNFEKELLHTAAHINDDKFRFLYELIQNADDCDYPENCEKCFTLEIGKSDNEQNQTKKQMTVSYPENGMTNADVISITTIGESAKVKRRKQKKLIGEKGRGFHTIFSCCDEVKIYSGGFNFSLKSNEIQPNLIESLNGDHTGTTMVMILKDKITVEKTNNEESSDETQKKEIETEEQESNVASIKFEDIAKNYGVNFGVNGVSISKQDIINNCPILFTNKIEKIVIKEGDRILQIKRIFNCNNDTKNTVKIEYFYSEKGNINEKYKIGEIELFLVNKDVEVDYKTYNGRYPDVFSESEYTVADEKLKKYTITIACPKDLKEDNAACVVIGKLYSYMPTSVVLNAPIIINIPAKLTENRGCIVTPNDKAFITKEGEGWIAWNELFLKNTFMTYDNNNSALKCFYETIRDNDELNVMNYLPDFGNKKSFFHYANEDYSADVNRLNVYCEEKSEEDGDPKLCAVKDEYKNNIEIFKLYKDNTDKIEENSGYVSASRAFVLDGFMHDTFKDVLEKYKLEERCYVDYSIFKGEQSAKAIDMGIKKFEIRDNIYGFVNDLLCKSKKRDMATQYVITELSKADKSLYVNTTSPSKLEIIPVKTNRGREFISAEEEKNNVFVYYENGINYVPYGSKYKVIDVEFFTEGNNQEDCQNEETSDKENLYSKLKGIMKDKEIIEIKINKDNNIINTLSPNTDDKEVNSQDFIDVFSIISSIKNKKSNEKIDWFKEAADLEYGELYGIVTKCMVDDKDKDKDEKELQFEKLGLIRYYKEGKRGEHKMRLLPDKWDKEIRDLVRRGIQDGTESKAK